MDLNYQILQIDLYQASEDIIEKYLDFQEDMHKSIKRDVILYSRRFRKMETKIPVRTSSKVHLLFVLIKNRIVASGYAGFTTTERETNPERVYFDIRVLQDYRSNGLAKHLLGELIDFATVNHKTMVEIGYFPVDGEKLSLWIKRLGFIKGIEEKESRLYRENINWQFIENKENNIINSVNKLDIISYTSMEWAEKVLKDNNFAMEVADFDNEVDNLAPTGNLGTKPVIVTPADIRVNAKQVLKTGDKWGSMNFAAMDGEKIVGASGTYYANDPPIQYIGTGFTGVRKVYQKQGLATLLKIKMLRYYVVNFPDFKYIFTANATSNESMLAINTNLGFRLQDNIEYHKVNIGVLENNLMKNS